MQLQQCVLFFLRVKCTNLQEKKTFVNSQKNIPIYFIVLKLEGKNLCIHSNFSKAFW